MPLPMVHLAVAVATTGDLQHAQMAGYLLGNLAPDAIHMRPGSAREDKQRTHLRTEIDTRGPEVVHELVQQVAPSGAPDALLLGYAVHLLTDTLWLERVWVPMMERLSAHTPNPPSRQEKTTIYYRETDEIDRLLYLQMPWRPEVWRQLSRAEPRDLPGLVTAREVALWRERTLNWFDHLAPATEPLRCLSLEQIVAFAAGAARDIGAMLQAWGYALPLAPGPRSTPPSKDAPVDPNTGKEAPRGDR